jgi:hypothetical protein
MDLFRFMGLGYNGMATNDGNTHLWDDNIVPQMRAFFMLISIEFAPIYQAVFQGCV